MATRVKLDVVQGAHAKKSAGSAQNYVFVTVRSRTSINDLNKTVKCNYNMQLDTLTALHQLTLFVSLK